MANRGKRQEGKVLLVDGQRSQTITGASTKLGILHRRSQCRAYKGLAMSEQEMLIDRILSASGIVGRNRRLEVEREMRAHIEDIIEEERAAGLDEKEIESRVALRFGRPGEIAQEFATVYRSQRIAFSLLSYSLLAVI